MLGTNRREFIPESLLTKHGGYGNGHIGSRACSLSNDYRYLDGNADASSRNDLVSDEF